MTAIYKYPISASTTIVAMPEGATVLTVQYQGDQLCLWAVVDNKKPLEDRCFEIFGTGEPLELPAEAPYIGTVQRGGLVWHLFEKY